MPEDGMQQIPQAEWERTIKGTRGDIASDGEEDHLVASRRDFGNQQPNDAPLEVEIRTRWFKGPLDGCKGSHAITARGFTSR